MLRVIEKPMLRDFTPRLYQETIFATAVTKNALVVLPTGMGKCLDGNEPILLEDGSIQPIGELVEDVLKNSKPFINKKNHIAAMPKHDIRVLALDHNMQLKPVSIIGYHKISAEEIIRIESESCASIRATPEHPMLIWREQGPIWIRTDEIIEGDRIACPCKTRVSSADRKLNILEIFGKEPKSREVQIIQDGETISLEHAAEASNNTLIWFKGTKTNPSKIKLISEASEDLLYWIGLMISEGRISRGILFYNANKKILQKFDEISEKIFGLLPEKIKGGRRLRSTALLVFLRWWGLLRDQHSKDKIISNNIMKLDNKCVRAFMRGLFDGDGSVYSETPTIEYTTASKRLASNLSYLLLRFGMRTHIKKRLQYATNSPKKKKRIYWRLRLSGVENLKKFQQSIGFSQKHKQEKLQYHLNKIRYSNTNCDTIPISGTFIRRLRHIAGLSSTKYKDFNLPSIDAYERGERGWSRDTLMKAIEGLQIGLERKLMTRNSQILCMKESQTAMRAIEALRQVCHSDIIWEKVTKVERNKEKQWVYDISLEKHFNFVAGQNGGFIAHNTAISAMLTVNRLQNHPDSKVIILAPTKPLAEQHKRTFTELLNVPSDDLVLFTGNVSPKKRAEMAQDARIIFSTPQGMENDLINGTFDLKNVSLMVFDEAHRAVGDYSYVFIAKQYVKKASFPRILALTASPGSDLEKITEVCTNLNIEAVEIRTDSDPDVQPYLQETIIRKVIVDLPEELKSVRDLLENCIKSKIKDLRKNGLTRPVQYLSKRELLAMQRQLHAKLASGERDFSVMKGLSVLAEAIKAQHALELVETQSVTTLLAYFNRMYAESKVSRVKAVQNLCADLYFKSAWIKTQRLVEEGIDHPKIGAVRELLEQEVEKNKMMKVILFTQYRDTAVRLKKELEEVPGIVPAVFVGQAKRGGTGLSQKQQAEMLQQFRDGLYNVLIATSVAEEGLDIPCVDMVVFYEPIPSAIRSIQRRGRTGRQEKGSVVLFITRSTRDEGYHYSAKAKEKKMQKVLIDLRTKINTIPAPKQATIHQYDSVLMFVDYREKNSKVINELVDMGLNVKLEQLDCADYVLSSRVGVELKKVPDFVASIIDGRFLEQLKSLRRKYDRPLVIIEGKEDLFSVRNVHPNAIRGMLATIAVSYGVPILYSKNPKDTAQLLYVISRREQSVNDKNFSLHADKKPITTQEAQEYIVSAIPNVGPALAKELLQRFGSIKNIVNASVDDLKKVPGVGKKKAADITRIFSEDYKN